MKHRTKSIVFLASLPIQRCPLSFYIIICNRPERNGTAMTNFLLKGIACRDIGQKQGILKGEVSLYHWTPVWLVWNQLYDNWQFLFFFAKQANPNQSNRGIGCIRGVAFHSPLRSAPLSSVERCWLGTNGQSRTTMPKWSSCLTTRSAPLRGHPRSDVDLLKHEISILKGFSIFLRTRQQFQTAMSKWSQGNGE